MKDYGREIAEVALKINAIKLSPENPFTWASGYRMPIYNDNRLLLGNYNHRILVAEGFKALIVNNDIKYEIIAGTSTAGIAPATTLANLLKCPLIYIRDKPKEHGLKKQIEGILHENQKVIVIEDLVSTGGSSVRAVEAVRNSGGQVNFCLSIFSYGLSKAEELFKSINCQLLSILKYNTLIEIAKEKNYINNEQMLLLKDWMTDPFNWGNKHGFPQVEK